VRWDGARRQLVVQGRSAESLLDAHASPESARAGGTQRQVQRITIGSKEIKSIVELAPLLKLEAADALGRFNIASTTFRPPST
jgi:hypothetical protein